MKKWLPLVIVFLAVLAGVWFWSLGALPDTAEPSLSTTSTVLSTDLENSSQWYGLYRASDTAFRDALRLHLKAWIGLDRLPSAGFSRGLVQASEGLHTKLTSGAIREQSLARYWLRRLAVIRRITEEGKSGLAYQEFSRMETELKQRTADGASKTDADAVREALRLSVYMYDDVGPEDSAYRVKQSLEDWRVDTAETPSDKMYVRLMNADIRIEEGAFDLAKQSLENIEREISQKDSGIEGDDKSGLLAQVKYLRSLAQAMADMTPPAGPVMPTSTIPLTAPTSTEAVVTSTEPVATSTPPVVEPATSTAALIPVSLTLSPAQKTLVFDESATFRAIAIYQNGLTKDVTKSVKFTYSPSGYGALNANTFKASQLRGTITVTGIYEESGTSIQGSSQITIVDKP